MKNVSWTDPLLLFFVRFDEGHLVSWPQGPSKRLKRRVVHREREELCTFGQKEPFLRASFVVCIRLTEFGTGKPCHNFIS